MKQHWFFQAPFFFFLKDTISHQKPELTEAAWEVSTQRCCTGKQPAPDFQTGEKRCSLNFFTVWSLSSQQSADELSSPEPPSFTLWHWAVFQGNAAVRFPPQGMGTHTSSWGQDRVWGHGAAPPLPQLPSQILSFQPRCGAAHPNARRRNSLWGKGRWGDGHHRETEALSTHTLAFLTQACLCNHSHLLRAPRLRGEKVLATHWACYETLPDILLSSNYNSPMLPLLFPAQTQTIPPIPAIMKKINLMPAKTSTHIFIKLLVTVITNFTVKQRERGRPWKLSSFWREEAWKGGRRSSVGISIFSLPDLQQNYWLEKETTRWELSWQCSLYAADHTVWPHHSYLSMP